MSETNISYKPSDGLCYDPADPKYWDEEALQKEITRAFEVCHGCRMCFKYCDSFPDLFSFIDDEHDGDVTKITAAQTQHVMDQCFQCKLCEVQCPYTPREGHEFQLDFPKIVHRYDAIQRKKNGTTLQEEALAHPNRTAALARASFGMANVMNRVGVHRWFLEKLVGIHRDKLLPDFAGTTFEKWARAEGRIVDAPDADSEAVLFPTCYVENNEPQIGRDTLEVLDRNQVDCKCTSGLPCCGMPAWERGNLELLRKQAHELIDKLHPFAKAGKKVVALSPTCTMMLKREYQELVAPEYRERAKELSEAVVDPGELLWSLRKEERFNTEFATKPENGISYHAPCHLRAQGSGFGARNAMRKMFGVKIDTTMECCGHDGTWAMTVEGFEPSQRVGKRAFDGMKQQGTGDDKVWATDCALAGLQFEQHAGKRALHPMTILARAYRGEPIE